MYITLHIVADKKFLIMSKNIVFISKDGLVIFNMQQEHAFSQKSLKLFK